MLTCTHSLSAIWLASLVVDQGGWQDLDNFMFEWVLTDEPSVRVWLPFHSLFFACHVLL